ncbi:MAG: PKD domain-containing protein [Verrucomicrobia bacterium]|nr:PKD domain-containing protein [Verrucomicrobiota bacterium]
MNLPPLANFAAAPTNGLAPLLVAFTNLSANATGYAWNFGDGKTSAAANPANTYTNAGSYTVTLTALGAGGTNALTRTNLIVVTNLPPPLLVVTPALVDFGLVVTGATAQAAFVISNGGVATLTGTATGAGAPFSVISGDVFSLTTAATTNLVLRFAPETPGAFSNQIVFASNGGAATNAVVGHSSGPLKIFSLPFSGDAFEFSFLTVSGLTYQVRYKDSLLETNWQLWQTVAGDGTVQTLTNPLPPVPQRFYQLRVP